MCFVVLGFRSTLDAARNASRDVVCTHTSLNGTLYQEGIWHCNAMFNIHKYIAVQKQSFLQVDKLPDPSGSLSTATFYDWFGSADDQLQIDPEVVQARLCCSPPVLQKDETVKMALTNHKDGLMTVIGTGRLYYITMIDGGLKYKALSWNSVVGFSVQTASSGFGSFDCNVEFRIWTKNRYFPYDEVSLRRTSYKGTEGKYKDKFKDLFDLQRYVAEVVFGPDVPDTFLPHDSRQKSSDGIGFQSAMNGLGWALLFQKKVLTQVDAVETETMLINELTLLRSREHVEFVLQAYNDMLIFTNVRFIMLTVDDWSPLNTDYAKKEYKSIPYTSILEFAITSARSIMDFKAKLHLYTDVPGECGGGRYRTACTHMKYKLKKSMDYFALQRVLAAHVCGTGEQEKHVKEVYSHRFDPPKSWWNTSWVGSGRSWRTLSNDQIDKLQETMTKDTPILLDDEQILMAYMKFRDYRVFTNKRKMILDVRGLATWKAKYSSMPYSSIMAFQLQTSGFMSWQDELTLWTKIADKDKAKIKEKYYQYVGSENKKKGKEVALEHEAEGSHAILKIGRIIGEQIFARMAMGRFPSPVTAEGRRNYADKYKISGKGCGPILEGMASVADGPRQFSQFIDMAFSGDHKQVDPDQVQQMFSQKWPVFVRYEKVKLAYKCCADFLVLTTHRILILDKSTLHSKNVKLRSFPYRTVQNFQMAGASAGFLDRDCHLTFELDVWGGASNAIVSVDLRKGDFDWFALEKFLSEQIYQKFGGEFGDRSHFTEAIVRSAL